MIQPSIKEGVAKFHTGDPAESCAEYWKVGQVLNIGKIVDHKGDVVTSLVLEPQGIAHLISEKCVQLPEDVCGFAHVLTRLCNDGLLTLNIGVVDPGWDNYLSTPVLNFSSEKRLLQVGEPFIRVTYHQIVEADGAERGPKCANLAPADYERGIRARAVGGFGKSFLNIKQLVGKASKKENARFKETMLKYLPIGAFSLAFFALLVTVGIATVARLANDNRQSELIEKLNSRIELLESGQRPFSASETAPAQDSAQVQKGSKGK